MRVLLVVLLAVMPHASMSALNERTHRLVNRQAVRMQPPPGRPSFDRYLREVLAFRLGLDTVLVTGSERLTVQEWIETGGEKEDEVPRFRNHFHNPLKTPWSTAGLEFGGRFESSVRWMQGAGQATDANGEPADDNWSWQRARRAYYESLTESDSVRREVRGADLFRALGQIMHLVVDASNPEHARNTEHANLFKRPSRSYEYWVSDGPEGHGEEDPAREQAFVTRFLSVALGFDAGILQQSAPNGEDVAVVPIARLVDTDRYDGTDPSVTLGTNIGIAEISNANFFTRGTFGTQFRFPSLTQSGLTRRNLQAPRPSPFQDVRAYIDRPAGLGLLPATPLAAVCASEKLFGLGLNPEEPCMDDNVWRQIAVHMLPRAVGYARGVLDYFFRGSATVKRIEWTAIGTQSGFNITLQNTSQEEMSGVFEIYGRLESDTPRERRMKLLAVAGGQAVRLAPNEERLFFTQIAKPPDWKATPSLVLVFKGRLGLEEDAVVGQVFTVPWVEITQTSYDADIAMFCDRPPERGNLPGQPGTTWNRASDTARCEWRASTHRVQGTIVTNRPIDPATGEPQLVIDTIEARWLGSGGGPAPLTLDGVAVPGGVWQRAGTEPDPQSFGITDPVDRGLAALFLFVNYRGGGSLSVRMASFGIVRSAHGKDVWGYDNPPQEFLATSGRSVSATLVYNFQNRGRMRFPLFGPISLGSASVPTDTRSFQTFHSFRSASGILATEDLFIEAAVDDFETCGDERPALEFYGAIVLEAPHPDGPFFSWTATVQRTFQPQELEFLRLFVTDTPTPHQVQLTGQVSGSPTLTSSAFTTSSFESSESSSSGDATADANGAALDNAWVEAITNTNDVYRATLSAPDGTTLSVGVGDPFGSDGGRIVAITEWGVTIERRFQTAGGELVVRHTLPAVK